MTQRKNCHTQSLLFIYLYKSRNDQITSRSVATKPLKSVHCAYGWMCMRVISKLLLFWLRIITRNRIHWHIDQKQHVYGILFEDSMVLSIYLTLYFLKMKRIDIDVREIIWFRLMHIKYASFCWFVSCLSLVVWFSFVFISIFYARKFQNECFK